MPIDKHVLNKIHHFTEVDRSSVPHIRNGVLEDVGGSVGAVAIAHLAVFPSTLGRWRSPNHMRLKGLRFWRSTHLINFKTLGLGM
jgi:hypothetical protein